MKSDKKIAFCITCRDRLSHIRQTLEKNIDDNSLLGQVEFILLDYHSQDGLEEWIKTLGNYIDRGFLTYYRTNDPNHYHRSHSRNMAFRLANADIICNLDADNFLGEGFAAYALEEFSKDKNIFITSDYYVRDLVGRICVRKDDFLSIRGYNELFSGYGFEDVDFFDRLRKRDIRQVIFRGDRFSLAVQHTNEERVSEEYIMKNLYRLYLSYITPYQTEFILLYKNNEYEAGTFVNNELCHYNFMEYPPDIHERSLDPRFRRVISGEMRKGRWIEKDIKRLTTGFYEISDKDILPAFIMGISEAINYKNGMYVKSQHKTVNKDGFGKGTVYKNFNYDKKIILT